MNLINAVVKSVARPPYRMFGKWWVDVVLEDMGGEFRSVLMFDARQEAYAVFPGYQCLT